MEESNKNTVITVLAVFFALGLTGPVSALAATSPSLGTAASYSILAGSQVTNTGATTISGSVGISPGIGAAPHYTGFGTVTLGGSIHDADAAAGIAQGDQNAAYTALAAQGCDTDYGGGTKELAGENLVPGVYCAGSFHLTSGILTLSGSASDVWIFKSASDLIITGSSADVVFSGGGSACNVWWRVVSTATFDADSSFLGNVLADTSITFAAGASLNGRAFARTAAVTLSSNSVTGPTCAPLPATLHVIKLVVNGNGGTAVSSNFTVHVKNAGVDVGGSPAAGVAAPGTAYSLSAGTYIVSEDANTSYTQSFSGACNSSGSVTLAAGEDKICTIINTDIPPPATVIPPAGVWSGGRIIPLIGVLKIPAPLALPAGSGSVTYNYTAWNVGGQQALTNVTLTDDKCSPVVLLSGDLNSNGKLDPHENWRYICTTTLSSTTTNTAIATGHSDDGFNQATIATAIATVVVGSPLPPPLINIVKVPSRLTPFPFGGGDVTYTYTVTNPGVVAMHNVVVTDDKCSPVSGPSPDANNNNLLDPGETRGYTCRTNVPVSTRNIATAQGRANGFTALSYAFANVLVSAPGQVLGTTTPGLPNTGFTPQEKSIPWNVIIFSGILAAASISFGLVFRKRVI